MARFCLPRDIYHGKAAAFGLGVVCSAMLGAATLTVQVRPGEGWATSRERSVLELHGPAERAAEGGL